MHKLSHMILIATEESYHEHGYTLTTRSPGHTVSFSRGSVSCLLVPSSSPDAVTGIRCTPESSLLLLKGKHQPPFLLCAQLNLPTWNPSRGTESAD